MKRFACMVAFVLVSQSAFGTGEGPGKAAAPAEFSTSAGAPVPAAVPANGAGALILVRRTPEPDPCRLPEATASPSRPNWSAGAATTQCGVLESDFGWQQQSMGAGAWQGLQLASLRYGLTPRMDLRWGLPGHVSQTDVGTSSLHGMTDQSLSITYRFHEQEARSPALALSYGIKIPTADPKKGFGTGYTDHQLTFIASRDLGRAHLDFNTVGTLAGGAEGHDGAAQFGLALSVQATKKFTWIPESDGGAQPCTPDRFGQALLGGQWALHPWLVLDAAWTRAFTAGSPRQQFTAGFTWSRQAMFPPIPRGARVARLLGR